MGGGRGWRNQFYATGLTGWQRAAGWAGMPRQFPSPPEQELAALKVHADTVTTTLGGIRKRIEELEAQSAGEKK
jgi:hypothetical protein